MNANTRKIGEVICDAAAKMDNWSPTTCAMSELQEHIDALEEIEELIVALGNRAVYLRGVMAARTVTALMS